MNEFSLHSVIWKIYTVPLKNPTHRRSHSNYGEKDQFKQFVEQRRADVTNNLFCKWSEFQL